MAWTGGSVSGRWAFQVRAEACGSASTTRTSLPPSAKQAARLTAMVVLPTPPFWLDMAMIMLAPAIGCLKAGKQAR